MLVLRTRAAEFRGRTASYLRWSIPNAHNDGTYADGREA